MLISEKNWGGGLSAFECSANGPMSRKQAEHRNMICGLGYKRSIEGCSRLFDIMRFFQEDFGNHLGTNFSFTVPELERSLLAFTKRTEHPFRLCTMYSHRKDVWCLEAYTTLSDIIYHKWSPILACYNRTSVTNVCADCITTDYKYTYSQYCNW